ncbi:transcriptional regulator [Cedecea colo]|uniref:Transcriptional regulator n=1 Tax=Cedecea colo TaxID=2552946 RepID=A0ABX0VLA1_9ENTR|nr:winged helix-turn-helix domain-containing protein [Cedecea colo]NIY47847.1 transcriptional regulator [Cedecea colo]
MHKHYVINGIVEFHPVTSKLRNLNNPEHVVVLNSPAGRCLLLLIERAGTIVTQQEFMDIVWQQRGMLVSPNTYYQNISILRKGLRRIGFINDPIVTIPRIGLTLASNTRIKTNEIPCISLAKIVDDATEDNGPLLMPEPVPEPQSDSIQSPCDVDDTSSAPLDIVECSDQKAPVVNGHKRWFLLMAVLAAVLLAGMGIMSPQAARDDRYLDRYRFVMTADDCRFFVSTNIQTDDEQAEALSYGKRFKANCKNYPWVYINRYAMLPRASVIRCDREMAERNHCISDYFIEDR